MNMNFDHDGILNGQLGIAEAGRQLFDLMLATASGRRSRSKEHGLGGNEFLPWQIGAVM